MHSCWLTSGIVRSLVTPRGSLLISSALTDFQEKVPEWTQQKPLGELQLHRLVWVIKPTQPSCPPLTGGQICHTALLYVLLGHLFSITSWSSTWSVDLKVRLVNRFTVKAEILSQNEVWVQKYRPFSNTHKSNYCILFCLVLEVMSPKGEGAVFLFAYFLFLKWLIHCLIQWLIPRGGGKK